MRLALGCVLFVGCALDRNGLGEPIALDEDAQTTTDTFVSADSTVEDTGSVVESATSDTEIDVAPEEPADASPVDPIYIECESGTLVGGMALEANAGASNGQWASVPTGASPWNNSASAPPVRVELPVTLAPETWYVWVSMFTRDGNSDAMYVGLEGGTFRRFYTLDWNKFVWVGAEGGGGGARLTFTPGGGATKLFVGVGDPGTGCDRVALTRDSTWTPP